MPAPFRCYAEFLEKAAILAHEMAIDQDEAKHLLKQLAEHSEPSGIKESPAISHSLPSRTELIKRLAKLRRDISLTRAQSIIDILDLPSRHE